jgi:hypothetical protein
MEALLDARQRRMIHWRLEGLLLREIRELDGAGVSIGSLSTYVKHAFQLIQRRVMTIER